MFCCCFFCISEKVINNAVSGKLLDALHLNLHIYTKLKHRASLLRFEKSKFIVKYLGREKRSHLYVTRSDMWLGNCQIGDLSVYLGHNREPTAVEMFLKLYIIM